MTRGISKQDLPNIVQNRFLLAVIYRCLRIKLVSLSDHIDEVLFLKKPCGFNSVLYEIKRLMKEMPFLCTLILYDSGSPKFDRLFRFFLLSVLSSSPARFLLRFFCRFFGLFNGNQRVHVRFFLALRKEERTKIVIPFGISPNGRTKM